MRVLHQRIAHGADVTDYTVIGVSIEPRKPMLPRGAPISAFEHNHRMKVRYTLERSPFLAAFDAGIDEVKV